MQPELLPYQKYSQAISICNNLAMLASQSTMVVFFQRTAILRTIENCWTKGLEAKVVPPDDVDEVLLRKELQNLFKFNDDGINIKLEPEFPDPRIRYLIGDGGDSSDGTIVNEQLMGSVELIEEEDQGKIEAMIEEEQLVTGRAKRAVRRGRPRTKEKKAKVTKRKGRKKDVKEEPEEMDKPVLNGDAERILAENSDSSYKFLCLVCKDVFETFAELKAHKSQAHGPITDTEVDMPLSSNLAPQTTSKKCCLCPVCDRSYQTASKLRIHMMVHTGVRPHVCNLCGRGFAKKEIFKVHMRVHTGERPHKCPDCGMCFGQFADLSYHQKARHTGEKPCVCNECGKQFRKSTLLMYHMRTHTGEKPFQCSSCDRKFARPSQLAEHSKMHSDVKAYLCPDCGRTFRTHNNLNRHKRMHLTVKPYSCSECDRSFTQLYNLKAHMRTHTGQKPYSCEKCGKLFSHHATLKKHSDVHLNS